MQVSVIKTRHGAASCIPLAKSLCKNCLILTAIYQSLARDYCSITKSSRKSLTLKLMLECGKVLLWNPRLRKNATSSHPSPVVTPLLAYFQCHINQHYSFVKIISLFIWSSLRPPFYKTPALSKEKVTTYFTLIE